MAESFWTFEALDTLFFRDGKPFNAGEWGWIESIFPPNGQTVQGAIRTAVLECLGADLTGFARGGPCLPGGKSLREELGDASGLGRLHLVGPFLTRSGSLLFPAPLDLAGVGTGFVLLRPREAVECDLGRVRLPAAKGVGLKVQEGKFVTLEAMEALLAGRADAVRRVVRHEADETGSLWPLTPDVPGDPALADREPRIGLARENEKRTAKQGMLYAIAPVWPREEVGLAVAVRGLSPSNQPPSGWIQRLGGEGKLAAVRNGTALRWPASPVLPVLEGKVRFKLVLTTPAHLPVDGWLPEGYRKVQRDGVTEWEGVIAGVGVTILSACLGKPVKIGGWNLAWGAPRDLSAFVPAGSVYFCEATAEEMNKVSALHCTQIGGHVEYGYGHVLVGAW